MGDVTIDEDDLSDEYDFMDEDDEAGERRRQDKERRRSPQYKYKDVLQQLADRTIDEIIVDLDDLATVSAPTALSLNTSLLTPVQWEKQNDASLKLVQSIEMNTKHYVDIVSRAVDSAMPQPSTDVK